MVEHRVALAQAQLPRLDRQELFVLPEVFPFQPRGGGGIVAGVNAQNHRLTAAHERCLPLCPG